LFKQFGNILSCKLESYPDGGSRGFAYVQFESEEQAVQAKDKMNGFEINNKKIEVIAH
jgi:polyadenylate-binding protein